jgi:hypothetical protein
VHEVADPGEAIAPRQRAHAGDLVGDVVALEVDPSHHACDPGIDGRGGEHRAGLFRVVECLHEHARRDAGGCQERSEIAGAEDARKGPFPRSDPRVREPRRVEEVVMSVDDHAGIGACSGISPHASGV